eukprot:CAMPEP_0170622070 /NCGR_PEP_ID=MMETSP0224-20130122/28932_1 /TAXON_ID=285029 /ORGANISM="Togula jolla, Strain CCCM 725" /LENGTH=239 /DNA_ID=CAMNT_0010948359 /DNA_START=60 /DNA_END=776 /DNA_ORIENTATION=+
MPMKTVASEMSSAAVTTIALLSATNAVLLCKLAWSWRKSKQEAESRRKASWLTKVDHVAYACAPGTIKKWCWFHTEVEGGTLINRIDDVRPGDPDSSMMIWCIDYGNFGIALVEGIDRAQVSQVTRFTQKHGDHAVQHVAYDTTDLDAFRKRLGSFGGQLRGDTLTRNDGFGILKQMFARGYEEGNAAEASFPEYVQRPQVNNDAKVAITFSKAAGKGFYDQIENAVAAQDNSPMLDWS